MDLLESSEAAGYDKELWGVAFPLAYTIPRRTLRITGAPPTKYSNAFQLPHQPWGVTSDNDFLSLEAAADANGDVADLTTETLANDSSMAFLRRFHGEEQPTDETIRYYIQHQDHNIRFVAANKAIGINSGYIGWRSLAVRSEMIWSSSYLDTKMQECGGPCGLPFKHDLM